tara:strand:+ start:81 stop:962 length:882 start_codon:yes stop_codon:yes gene_type:complete
MTLMRDPKRNTPQQPHEVIRPADQLMPVVFSSPHSGKHYTESFLSTLNIDLATLRQLEDCFVDELFSSAPELGAPMLRALFPRAYIDPNREPYELDPEMFDEDLPDHANTTSARVAVGLGTIARLTTTGEEIYGQKLTVTEAEYRIESYHRPFHQALKTLITNTKARFGYAVLIDCHSMPSIDRTNDRSRGKQSTDIILGDRFGTSCSANLIDTIEDCLINLGYHVTRNIPYAGGYTTEHYGCPNENVHAIQLEINRSLYMDQKRLRKHRGIARTSRNMKCLIETLARLKLAL